MLKNDNWDANWKVGDTAYVYDRWAQTIVETKVHGLRETDLSVVATTDRGDRVLPELFRDIESAHDALGRWNDERTARLMAEMTDAASIVRFAWEHCVSNSAGEYTDWEARAAFKSAVKSVLGVELP